MIKEKTCFRCNTTKPLGQYYKHKRMADGHLNKCKECTKADSQNRYSDKMANDPTFKHSERRRTRERNKRLGYGSSSEAATEAKERWRKKNRDKANAMTQARRTHKEVQPCVVCGNEKGERHHPDYSKPKEILWLCRKHHAAWHRVFIPEYIEVYAAGRAFGK